jgi:hypothetical protein
MYTKSKIGGKHIQPLQLSPHIPNRQQYMHHTFIFPIVLNMCVCVCVKCHLILRISRIKGSSTSDTQMQCGTLNMWKNRTVMDP